MCSLLKQTAMDIAILPIDNEANMKLAITDTLAKTVFSLRMPCAIFNMSQLTSGTSNLHIDEACTD